jgi:hypothetical protein
MSWIDVGAVADRVIGIFVAVGTEEFHGGILADGW